MRRTCWDGQEAILGYFDRLQRCRNRGVARGRTNQADTELHRVRREFHGADIRSTVLAYWLFSLGAHLKHNKNYVLHRA